MIKEGISVQSLPSSCNGYLWVPLYQPFPRRPCRRPIIKIKNSQSNECQASTNGHPQLLRHYCALKVVELRSEIAPITFPSDELLDAIAVVDVALDVRFKTTKLSMTRARSVVRSLYTLSPIHVLSQRAARFGRDTDRRGREKLKMESP